MTGNMAFWPGTDDGQPMVELSLGAMLDRQAAQFADRPALAVQTEGAAVDDCAVLTYAELRDRADTLARGLIALGVLPGDHVALMGPNSVEWVLLEYAIAKAGAVMVTVNPAYRAGELHYVLTQGRVSHLFHASQYRGFDIDAAVADLRPRCPDLRVSVSLSGGPMTLADVEAMAPGCPSDTLAARQAAVAAGAVAQIQYTSGTTGRPKGAMLTHRGTINNARLMGARAGYGNDEVLLSPMPFFHTAGCVCNVMGMLNVGGMLVSTESFDPRAVLDLWDRFGATMINAVPTMWMRMLDAPGFSSRPRPLRRANMGGTSIPPSLVERIHAETGAEPMIIMGMTECSPIITQTDPRDDFRIQITTAGTPLPHTELRIVDPDSGRTVAFGEEGELCIRGYLTTPGYFDMPDRTAETIDADGWLHSGDLARLDEHGHLGIVGRLKDMIIRGGENVYPAEIENHLLAHDTVSQAQVVGIPDPDLGEEVCAFVIAAPGRQVDPAELQQFCRGGLARSKMPKVIRVVDSYPLTASGKVQKFELRRIATEAPGGNA